MQLLLIKTATGIATGAIGGRAVAVATGTANVSTSAAVGTIGATEDVVVVAPVILPAFAVEAVVGGLGAGFTKLFDIW